jgi:hypothetical protein
VALAPNTLRGYETDWKDFAARCQEQGRESLSAETAIVSLYLPIVPNVSQRPASPGGSPPSASGTSRSRPNNTDTRGNLS